MSRIEIEPSPHDPAGVELRQCMSVVLHVMNPGRVDLGNPKLRIPPEAVLFILGIHPADPLRRLARDHCHLPRLRIGWRTSEPSVFSPAFDPIVKNVRPPKYLSSIGGFVG